MTRILAAAALAALTLAAPAGAGTLDTLDCPAQPVKIVVLGDSLADGLWGSFFRAFAACDTVRVLRRTQVSDGLARTAPDDWAARLGEEATGADLVVVQVGANDITNIREGTTRHVFGTEDWDAAYAARAGDLAAALAEAAPRLVWMGLPIVGQERYEDSYRRITALQEAAVTAAGARFVDTHAPTTFGAEGFVATAEWEGSVRRVRVSDQVHFTELGYDIVAGLLAGEVQETFRAAARDAAMGDLVLQ